MGLLRTGRKTGWGVPAFACTHIETAWKNESFHETLTLWKETMTPNEMTAAREKLATLNAQVNKIVDDIHFGRRPREEGQQEYCKIIDQVVVIENQVLDAGGKL